MSLIAYSEGWLVADRNCEDRDSGVTFSHGEMKKIHISPCGSVALAFNGAYRSKPRIEYLLSLLVAKLRVHQIENEDSIFVSTIDLTKALNFFGDDGSWIVMTKDKAYSLEDGWLLELAPEQTTCSGTMRAPYMLFRNRFLDPVTALVETIKVSPCASKVVDSVEQCNLADLYIDAELVSAAVKLTKGAA